MKKDTSLVFTGDIGFDNFMSGKWTDPDLLADELVSFLRSGDHVIANVEGAVCKADPSMDYYHKGFVFHTQDPAIVPVLQNIHADIWNLANNHAMDAGPLGLEKTMQEAAAVGSRTIGAGKNIEAASTPLYLDEAGGIGLLSMGYQPLCVPASETEAGCLSWSALDVIEQRIREIKKTCRWCIIVCHAGAEFANLPSRLVRNRYHQYLQMGADIVVAHHPHVAECYETLPGKAIFYSLGNFIFDTGYQRAQYNTDRGVLLKLKLTETDFTFEAQGTRLIRGEEHLVADELPAIFTDVQAEDYEKLLPLSSRVFMQAERLRKIFSNPAKFGKYSVKEWHELFSSQGPSDHMALPDYWAEAQQARKGAWRESKLEAVKQYILDQM